MYQIEKAQRQNTLLPSWEERQKGQKEQRKRLRPAQPQVGMGQTEEGCKVSVWVEHERANILTGL